MFVVARNGNIMQLPKKQKLKLKFFLHYSSLFRTFLKSSFPKLHLFSNLRPLV